MSIASFRERLLDLRSRRIVFIRVVQVCLGGLLQLSKGAAAKIFLTSVSSGILTMWLDREKCHVWTIAAGCGSLVVCITA